MAAAFARSLGRDATASLHGVPQRPMSSRSHPLTLVTDRPLTSTFFDSRSAQKRAVQVHIRTTTCAYTRSPLPNSPHPTSGHDRSSSQIASAACDCHIAHSLSIHAFDAGARGLTKHCPTRQHWNHQSARPPLRHLPTSWGADPALSAARLVQKLANSSHNNNNNNNNSSNNNNSTKKQAQEQRLQLLLHIQTHRRIGKILARMKPTCGSQTWACDPRRHQPSREYLFTPTTEGFMALTNAGLCFAPTCAWLLHTHAHTTAGGTSSCRRLRPSLPCRMVPPDVFWSSR